MEAKKRLDYIDGIKGLCALLIGLFHFLLMFKIDGYINWGCLEEAAANPVQYYLSAFPYSILTNYNFPLYLFMGIISFIPAYKYWTSNGNTNFEKSVITRYFRFMPFTLVSCLLSVLFYRCSLYSFDQFAELTGNTWIALREECDYSFFNAFYEGLYGLFIPGGVHGGSLVSSLWCVYYLFIGSMITYAVLALCGNIKRRVFVYVFLTAFLWHDPTYVCFVGGLIAADILCSIALAGRKHVMMLCFVFGILLSVFPPVLLPGWLPQQIVYSVSIVLILSAVSVLFSESRLLSSKALCWLGKESFSFIIVHMFVMFSLNSYLYMVLKNSGLSDTLNIVLNIIVFYAASFVTTYAFGKVMNPVTNTICSKVYQIVNGSNPRRK